MKTRPAKHKQTGHTMDVTLPPDANGMTPVRYMARFTSGPRIGRVATVPVEHIEFTGDAVEVQRARKVRAPKAQRSLFRGRP